MKKDEVYLKDMLDATDQILEYCKGYDYIKFANTKLIQDAVMRNLEILGEAAKKLSTDLREKNPDLPIKEAIGMRNLLVHEYDYVNVDEVWKVVEEDLPELANQLRKLL
ncbi:MAG: DUF86 domain-containing protein [Patescibacteria group bacterium]|jgi:uncharacterized protein with HEPN domain